MLSRILRYIIHHNELTDKLENSHFMRRAAQITASFIIKGKAIGMKSIEKIEKSPTAYSLENMIKNNRLQSFIKRFSDELREGFKKKKIKD